MLDVVDIQSGVENRVKQLASLNEGVEVGLVKQPRDDEEQLIGQTLEAHDGAKSGQLKGKVG